jgi:hypothetical protein
MTTTVLGQIDLAELDADSLLRLWERVDTIKTLRAADPELREAMIQRAELLDRLAADQIKLELDTYLPAVVLAAHWRELVPDSPALGAYLTGAR